MRVLVVGGSRGIGRETVDAVLTYGHRPVVLARSPYPGTGSRVGEKDWISADAQDPVAVSQAVKNIDAVIISLGISHADLFKPVSLFSSATRAVIGAMKTEGVKRLIVVTGFGAGRSRKQVRPWERLPFELLFGRAYRDKDVQEALTLESGLDWTIVRPGVLTNGPRTGRYSVLTRPDEWRNGLIARKDVAAFIAQNIADPTFIHRDVVLVG